MNSLGAGACDHNALSLAVIDAICILRRVARPEASKVRCIRENTYVPAPDSRLTWLSYLQHCEQHHLLSDGRHSLVLLGRSESHWHSLDCLHRSGRLCTLCLRSLHQLAARQYLVASGWCVTVWVVCWALLGQRSCCCHFIVSLYGLVRDESGRSSITVPNRRARACSSASGSHSR